MGSSIPLPALAIQPPPNPVEQYARMAQLKGLLQQEQTQQQMAPYLVQNAQQTAQSSGIDLQLKQQQLNDQKAIAAILYGQQPTQNQFGTQASPPDQQSQQPQGETKIPAPDPDRFASKLAQIQSSPDVSPAGKLGITKQLTEMQQQYANLDSTKLANQEKVMSMVGDGLTSVANAAPEDQAAQYMLERNALLRDPLTAQMAQQIPAQFPGSQGLQAMMQRYISTKDMTEWLKQQATLPGEKAKGQQEVTAAAQPTPQQIQQASNTVNTYAAIPPNMRQAFSAELASAPDFETLQKIQARADAANESFQRSADARQQAAAMRDVGVQTQLAEKLAGEDQKLGAALDQTTGIRQLLDMSKGGNQAATAAAQTRFAEHEIVEGGVKRMNEIEYRNLASSLGSYGRKFSAWADGGFKGQMPPATNAEMQTILDAEDANSNATHDRNVGYFVNRFSGVNGMKANATAQGNTGRTNAQPNTGGQPKPAVGMTRIKASDGTLHDVPTANLGAARKIDPGLQVIQ